MTPDEKLLLDSWPWLRSEFARVRSQLDQLGDAITSQQLPFSEAARKLIQCAQIVCTTLRKAETKGLFRALKRTSSSIPSAEVAQLRQEIRNRLSALLEEEEALLVRVGMEPSAARALRNDLAALPSEELTGSLVRADFDNRVSDALSAVCARFPRSETLVAYSLINTNFASLKKKYGLLGAATLASGNLAAVALDPTGATSAALSKFLAAMLAGSSIGDA